MSGIKTTAKEAWAEFKAVKSEGKFDLFGERVVGDLENAFYGGLMSMIMASAGTPSKEEIMFFMDDKWVSYVRDVINLEASEGQIRLTKWVFFEGGNSLHKMVGRFMHGEGYADPGAGVTYVDDPLVSEYIGSIMEGIMAHVFTLEEGGGNAYRH